MINKVKNFLKRNIIGIVIYITLIVILLIEFPYYIEAPGGIINIQDRIKIDNNYKSNGTLNLSYVSEYKATLITLLYSFFNKDWKVISTKDVLANNETASDYELRDKLLLEESYTNAIYLGYKEANCEVEVLSEELYVDFLFEDSNTNLEVGDKILEIDGKKVTSKDEVNKMISSYNIGDKVDIKVYKNNKEYIRQATLVEYDKKPIIGISIVKIRKIKTKPDIDINYKSSESGPSGGLMLSLAIYNNLTPYDITNGKTIVGTGTIDEDGNVGSIGGVQYKLKAAVKNNADIFIVPNGENYEDAMKLKKKNHYEIEIKGVSTFNEAITYLKNRE